MKGRGPKGQERGGLDDGRSGVGRHGQAARAVAHLRGQVVIRQVGGVVARLVDHHAQEILRSGIVLVPYVVAASAPGFVVVAVIFKEVHQTLPSVIVGLCEVGVSVVPAMRQIVQKV